MEKVSNYFPDNHRPDFGGFSFPCQAGKWLSESEAKAFWPEETFSKSSLGSPAFLQRSLHSSWRRRTGNCSLAPVHLLFRMTSQDTSQAPGPTSQSLVFFMKLNRLNPSKFRLKKKKRQMEVCLLDVSWAHLNCCLGHEISAAFIWLTYKIEDDL